MRIRSLIQVVLIAGGQLAILHWLVPQFAGPQHRLYQFIYERSSVQHATLAVAALVIALLVERWIRLRSTYGGQKKPSPGRDTPPQGLVDQLDVVSRAYDEHGTAAAVAQIQQLSDDGRERIRKAYESIHALAGFLPALGLLGTMLGLSGALFDAFASGKLTDQAVQQFVSSLATALDTTVLAMLCAAPVFVVSFFLCRRENELHDRQIRYVKERLGIAAYIANDNANGTLQAELRRVTRKIAAEAESAFGKMLEHAGQALQEHLTRAVEEAFAAQRQHDQDILGKVAEDVAGRLAHSLQDMGVRLERHNGQLAEGMIQQVGQLERALRNRTPEEVIVRYKHNGQVPRVSRLGADPHAEREGY